MLGALARGLFGTANDRIVKGFDKPVAKINALEPELAKLSDEQLRNASMLRIFGMAFVLCLIAAWVFAIFLGPRPPLHEPGRSLHEGVGAIPPRPRPHHALAIDVRRDLAGGRDAVQRELPADEDRERAERHVPDGHRLVRAVLDAGHPEEGAEDAARP